MRGVDAGIGILAVAQQLPERVCRVEEIFEEEGSDYSPEIAQRLGIRNIHLCRSESGSMLALRAAKSALDSAAIEPEAVDIIVDYSSLPQEYLAPAWNMSNKIQHELGASKSFTIGFSGAGSTNLLVAMDFAFAMLLSDRDVNTILLLGADVTISGNHLLNPQAPLTVVGDGSSALVVGRNAKRNLIRGVQLSTRGYYHDICYIPGGGMTHPTRSDLYRLQIDVGKYASVPKYEILAQDAGKVLTDSAVEISDIKHLVVPNLSAEDQAECVRALGIRNEQIQPTALVDCGHVQANDLAFNLISMLRSEKLIAGDLFLMCSHGMGFTSGAMLIQC